MVCSKNRNVKINRTLHLLKCSIFANKIIFSITLKSGFKERAYRCLFAMLVMVEKHGQSSHKIAIVHSQEKGNKANEQADEQADKQYINKQNTTVFKYAIAELC